MITIELFAAFAEYTGTRSLEIEYRKGLTCAQLWEDVNKRYPKVAGIRPLFAVGNEYISADTEIHDGQKILIFPPVSGG